MFAPLPARFDFPEAEKRVLAFWREARIFERSLEQRADAPRFVFYEGPPTANGKPHPGHCLTRAMKDLFPRYRTMAGYLVERKAGWDTHGLPVEVEVCKELGIHTKEEIEAYGVEKFNLKCIQSVFRYTREWEEMTRRLGFWVNLDDAYVTFHKSYVESVWWGLKTLFERGLLYEGHKVVWWWAQGGTALSSGEVGEGYRTVDDPSVFVKFPLVADERLRALPGSIGVSPVRHETDSGSIGVSPVRPQPSTQPHGGVRGEEITAKLSRYRRILPHWEAGGSTYILTFRVHTGELSNDERSLVLDACRHWDTERMLLHAAVVMPDHVHILCTPLEKTTGVWWSVADLMHSIKSFTAKKINERRGSHGLVWQREYFDRIIRNEDDFAEKWNYIVSNPQRRGLPDTYEWVWVEPSHLETHRRDADAPRAVETAGSDSNVQNSVSHRRDADAPRTDELLVSHRRDADAPRISLLVWTTTPWTLISNHFAAVHPELEYALVEDPGPEGGVAEHYIVASALVETLAKKVKREFKVLSVLPGTALIGLRYSPPFDEYSRRWGINTGAVWIWKKNGPADDDPLTLSCDECPDSDPTFGSSEVRQLVRMRAAKCELSSGGSDHIGWRVLAADFVTLDSGTGLVHEAPAFGEVDFDLLQRERSCFTTPNALPLLNAVNPDGTFNDDAPERYRGRWVKDCDKEIIRELRDERRTPWGTPLLLHQEQYRHEYPFCPRAENDPLIQYARKSWFVRTSQFKDEFLKNNAQINWLPDHIRDGRFGDFLRNNVDWALSRERYWGTPLPVWKCEKCRRMEAIGSFAELQARPGATDGGYWEQKVREHAGEDFPEHLRVHKPYIDEWTYECETCAPARMRRVPEVIDCWWDAGSMPFAQWGYPHAEGSVERFNDRFPADFISEAIDQTRGWFYALLAISTLLMKDEGQNARPTQYPLPYRTCIVLGHIAGEDGLKMSKRLKNYREPAYIFDTYGADAMRWYFYSGQAPWTSVRFQEATIRDAQRDFLVKIYNVLSFFSIYASIDAFGVSSQERSSKNEVQTRNPNFVLRPSPFAPGNGRSWRPVAERSELDRWAVSELHLAIRAARESLDRFENFPAAQRLSAFVDGLSNWYVRRSRDRFWRSVEARDADAAPTPADQDKWDAYNTLYECLEAVSRLVAPFTPFVAEAMHQYLTGRWAGGDAPIPADANASSVHLCDYPTPDADLIDESLAAEMDWVREIASLGLAARAQAKLRVRQPLDRVEIILARREHEAWLASHVGLIAEELNVKKVEFTTEGDHYVSYQVKPNFKAIGPKFGGLAKKIAAALNALADAAAARKALLDTGTLALRVDGQAVELTPAEVEIRLEARPGWAAAQGRVGVVVLATEITPELRDEGLVREFIHHVQAARKEAGLAYEARIRIHVRAEEEFLALLRRYEPTLAAECLAVEVSHEPPAAAGLDAIQIDGRSIELAISPIHAE